MKFLTIFFIILPSLAFSEMKLFECKSQNIKMIFNFNFNEQSYSMIRDYKTNNVDMFIPFIKKGEIYLNEYKLSNHELFLLGSDNSFLNVLIRVKKEPWNIMDIWNSDLQKKNLVLFLQYYQIYKILTVNVNS